MNLPDDIREKYEIHEWRHALAILHTDFREEWDDLVHVLRNFTLPKSSIITRGGSKSPIAKNINGMFQGRGWREKSFDVSIIVDGEKKDSPTHSVDFFKNGVAIETEWNNKDPFYDRDLNNFRLLYELRVINLGIIITRSDELQEIFNKLGRGKSYGASTTHMSKLLPKINGGGSGGCPVLSIGITGMLYDDEG